MTIYLANVGIYTPYDKEYPETVPRFAVYEGSTINGERITDIEGIKNAIDKYGVENILCIT